MVSEAHVTVPVPESGAPISQENKQEDAFASFTSVEQRGSFNEGVVLSLQSFPQQYPPTLNTIDPSSIQPSRVNLSRKVQSLRDIDSSLSPRSIDMSSATQSTINGNTTPENTPAPSVGNGEVPRPRNVRRHSEADVIMNNASAAASAEALPRPSSKPRHRRTMSGSYGEQSPIRAVGPPIQMAIPPPTVPLPAQRHHRNQSWSGAGAPLMINNMGVALPPPNLQMHQHPPPFHSGGNPFMPNLSSDQPSFPPPAAAPQASGQRKRKERHHRRALSSSAAVPGAGAGGVGGGRYNEFFQSPGDLPPPPPPKGGSRGRSSDFNPRSEFLSLTGTAFHQSLRGKEGLQLRGNVPLSPMPPTHNSSSPHPYSPNTAQFQAQDMHMGQYPPQDLHMTASWTPTRQQHKSYGGMHPNEAQMFMPSPHGPSPHAPPSPAGSYSSETNGGAYGPNFGPGPGAGAVVAGGEAVFLANKLSKSQRPKSSRIRHMRQQSAQLFMEDVKGQPQPPACRDILFLLLFLFHLVGMMYLGTTYGHDAFDPIIGELQSKNSSLAGSNLDIAKSITDSMANGIELYYENLIILACLSGAFAMVVSALFFTLVAVIAQKFVQVALVMAIAVSFVWGTLGVGLSPRKMVPVTGFIAFVLCIGYSVIVWERIPFCASNLHTALSGIRANIRTIIIAIFFQIVVLIWSVYFIVVVVGVFDAQKMGKLDLSDNVQIFIYTMLGISFYWTYNVILNLVQVTTAGIVGSWWYFPSGQSDSQVICESFFKSMFYGLGSICFGSLLVGPVRVIRQLSAFVRPANSEDASSLLCCHECLNCIQTCISSYVDSMADHFNTFAFTYVGLYGYGFFDAGHHATELFRKRGWSMIVTDDLVSNVLLMTSVVIGGATGCFSHLVLDFGGGSISSLDGPGVISFVAGLLIGLVVTSVLFGVISSSVNTVIVCFAASPVDFENNHPELSREMRTAWRNVWPGCMDLVDFRVSLANSANLSNSVGMHSSVSNSIGMHNSLGGLPPLPSVGGDIGNYQHDEEGAAATESHPLLKN